MSYHNTGKTFPTHSLNYEHKKQLLTLRLHVIMLESTPDCYVYKIVLL